MPDLVVPLLAVACLLLALTTAALACCVPWLFWRCLSFQRRLRRAERGLRQVDTGLTALVEALGPDMARLTATARSNGKAQRESPPSGLGARS
jgi:hypothetical protein